MNFRALYQSLRLSLACMIARGTIRRVNDATRMQEVDVYFGGKPPEEDVATGLERFQNYGFSSVPFVGTDSEAAVVFVGGNRDHGLVLAIDSRADRPKNMQPGEVMIYARGGAKISLLSDGSMSIESQQQVTVNAPSVIMQGGQSLHLTSKVDVLIDCEQAISLVSGSASSIVLDPSGITITAPLVNINQA